MKLTVRNVLNRSAIFLHFFQNSKSTNTFFKISFAGGGERGFSHSLFYFFPLGVSTIFAPFHQTAESLFTRLHKSPFRDGSMADRLIKWLGYSTLTELRFCFRSPLSRYVFTFPQRIEKSEVANIRKEGKEDLLLKQKMTQMRTLRRRL